MSETVKVVANAMAGMILGLAVLFLSVVAIVGYSFATGQPAAIPGVFDARAETYDGLPSLSFVPNFVGMLVFVVLVTAVYVLLSTGIMKRLSRARVK